jgi:multiple sugar transport system permease protein
MTTVSDPTKKIRKLWSKSIPYFLIAPVVIYYAFFWVRPVLKTVFESFLNAAGQFSLQNYVMVFTDPDFLPALRNTAIIVVFSVSLEFLAALFLALLINRKFFGSSIFLFLAMIPMALPQAAVGAMWLTGLTAHGWINSLLYYLGIFVEGQKIFANELRYLLQSNS